MPQDSLLDRAVEQERIRAFLACEGATRRLLLTGDAGIGKTSVWLDALEHARATGWQVLSARPDAAELGLAYSVAMELFGGLLDDVGSSLPEVQRTALDVCFLRRTSDTPLPRLAVGAALLGALRELARRGPVLIAIDDLQWADRESTAAFGYALRRLTDERVVFLGSARLVEPLSITISGDGPAVDGHVECMRDAEIITLGGLSVPAVRAAVRCATGIDPGSEGAARLCSSVGGNPLLAIEIVRAYGGTPTPGQLLVPPSAVDALAPRISALSDPARWVLCVVAAAGHADLDLVAAVLHDFGVDNRPALDAGFAQRVVIERNGTVAPAHPLLGSAALATLSPLTRREVHASIASHTPTGERRATHLDLSVAPGPETTVAAALDAAARSAQNRGASYASATFWRQAIDRTGADDPAVAERTIGLAAQLHRVGDSADAIELLVTTDQDGARLLRPVLLTGTLDVWDQLVPTVSEVLRSEYGSEVTAGILRRTQAALPPGDLRQVAIEVEVAYQNVFPAEDTARRVAAMVHTLEAQASRGVVLLRAMGFLAEVQVSLGYGVDHALLVRQEALERDVAPSDVFDTADATRAMWLRFVDDVAGARAAIARCDTREGRTEGIFEMAMFGVYRAATEVVAGDFPAAQRALPSLTDGVWNGSPPPVVLATAGRVLLACGRWEELDELLAQAQHWTAGTREFRELYRSALTGMLAVRREQFADAVSAFATVREVAARLELREPERYLRTDSDHAEALLAMGDVQGAERLAIEQEEFANSSGRVSARAVAARIRGLVAAHRGDLDDALAQSRDALTFFESTPLAAETGRTHLDLARIQRRRRARTEARRHAGLAREILARCGEKGLGDRARTEAGRERHRGDSDALTQGELRVARLAADGATNREIAARLFVSKRTVDAQLAATFRKLAIHSRRDLPDAIVAVDG